jgi:hypothetical protein
LIWVAQTTVGGALPLKARLERITKGELEKARRALAWFVLSFVVTKASLVAGIIDLTAITAKLPVALAHLNLISHGGAQWWQAWLLIDALLTCCLFFFADGALARLDAKTWSESVVERTLSVTSFFRGTLAVATAGRFFCWAFLNAFPAAARHAWTF